MRINEAIAELTLLLSCVTSEDRAGDAVRRALRSTGLAGRRNLDGADMQRLLAALAGEGGVIEQLAIQIAIDGIETTPSRRLPDPPDRSAA